MLEGLFQPVHLLVLAVIALFVFGPRRLPELGKGLGDGIRALKAGLDGTPVQTAAPARPEGGRTPNAGQTQAAEPQHREAVLD